jgi:hypothetical protein|uniref:Uncharacterized protein n=1 Tax=viral metagenome TaxID=1070528 RepID=A0A6C0DXC5_9ZZZZ
MIYNNSNLVNTEFEKVNFRENNRTLDDPCAIQQRDGDNGKKLKYMTSTFRELIEAKDNLNYFGMTMRDQLFVPSEKVDKYSEMLNGKSGNLLTQCNTRNGFGQLPFPTMPSKYQLSRGDVQIEDSMKNLIEVNKNSCNPRDDDFYSRYFYIFDDKQGIDTPDALKSVEIDDFGKRGGINTRFTSLGAGVYKKPRDLI